MSYQENYEGGLEEYYPEIYPLVFQTFLQSLIAAKSLSYPDAAQLLSKINWTYLLSSINIPVEILNEPIPSSELNNNSNGPISIQASVIPQECEKILPRFINALNQKLADLELSIKISRDQQSAEGIKYLTLANLHSTSGTKLATTLTSAEIDLVRNLLHKVIFSNKRSRVDVFYFSSQDAWDAYPKDSQNRHTITQSQAATKLTTLKDLGWLVEINNDYNNGDESRERSETLGPQEDDDEDDYNEQNNNNDNNNENIKIPTFPKGQTLYTLSTRALAELDRYIKDNLSDTLKTCQGCKEIFIVGYKCSKKACPVRYHQYCFQSYRHHIRNPTCPHCGSAADSFIPIGI